MKQKVIIIVFLTLLGVLVGSAKAAGTASGTSVNNTATLTYNMGGSLLSKTAVVAFVVDNKVIPTVVKNGDAATILGAVNQVLVFVLRNDGNTTQRYALSAINGSGFVMNNVRIYRDNGVIPGFLDATDTLYVDAATFGDVAVDGTLDLLIVADTPAILPGSNISSYHLLATTVDAGTTNVTTQTVGANTLGVDVVFVDATGSATGDVDRDGKHSDAGVYTISTLALAIVKSAVIIEDPENGTTNPVALPGATVVYTLAVTVSGPGTATNVVVTDPIPVNSSYKSGTLKLNGATLTDATGDDAGSVGGGPVMVTTNLGDLTSASAVQTITFDVLIDEYKL